jgi:hypothetical protein
MAESLTMASTASESWTNELLISSTTPLATLLLEMRDPTLEMAEDIQLVTSGKYSKLLGCLDILSGKMFMEWRRLDFYPVTTN